MWKIDPKDKHMYKNKHDHIHMDIQNIFLIVEPFYGTSKKKERKRE
jgi:hypothetical protein